MIQINIYQKLSVLRLWRTIHSHYAAATLPRLSEVAHVRIPTDRRAAHAATPISSSDPGHTGASLWTDDKEMSLLMGAPIWLYLWHRPPPYLVELDRASTNEWFHGRLSVGADTLHQVPLTGCCSRRCQVCHNGTDVPSLRRVPMNGFPWSCFTRAIIVFIDLVSLRRKPTNGWSHGRPSTWVGDQRQVPLTDLGSGETRTTVTDQTVHKSPDQRPSMPTPDLDLWVPPWPVFGSNRHSVSRAPDWVQLRWG